MSGRPEVTLEYLAENVSQPLFHTSVAFIVLECVVLTIFLAARYIKRPSDGGEMLWLVLLGFAFCEGLAVIGILLVKYGGAGRHMAAVDKATITRRLKLTKSVEFLYIPAVTFPKLAMLRLYMRLFASHRIVARYVAHATGAVLILLFIYGVIAPLVSCRPFEYNWNKMIPGGQWWDIMGDYRWCGFPNMMTDLALTSQSLLVTWRLQVPLPTKISLLLTFALGTVGFVMSIVRFAEFFRKDIFVDMTFYGANTMLWALVEPGTYFMAATLLTVRPLLRLVVKESKASFSGSHIRSKGSRRSRIILGQIIKTNHIKMKSGKGSIKQPDNVAFVETNGRHGFVRLEDDYSLRGRHLDLP
ncbi:hypothetical protein BDV96DRAFT_645381 [Lophiotrema nucula]|uniref:Rhodopsin domain-containing protein n=1 Tax=Lophiotrema nucula TaxID=690887 RepID=A0A6A5ZCB3_9PLEO|nr:hypothetical protein BDV96DRAFT_645381 [Lophiotrema nucula]